MMKRRMCGKKVLLVLDDVDHIDQLEALASEPNWFKPGSRILITTRDEQVLVAHRVNLIRDIDLLSDKEAICLFSRYAFGRENPLQGYEELSGKVVRYAAGLPLTVKVLGSFLCGKDMIEWEDAIARLKKIPLKETLEKLELSYISLEDDYKEIFLDIVCMLKRKPKADAIRILECCGFNAITGLKVLEQRSLVTIISSKYGQVLGMHDHIEEMGKNIVRRLHPNEPNKHSRLWIDEEIEDILSNDMGTEETRCLRLDMWRENSRILMNGLGKMKKLRYLDVEFAIDNNWESDPKLKGQYFSNSLKYLKCSDYPFLYLPKTFQANNLVGLEMFYSRRMVQLWEEEEKKVLKKLSCQKLKHLNIRYSKLRTFDLGLTPNLETLSLSDCADFVKLHVSVPCPNLKFLNLRRSRLRSLDLELIPNLESLDLAYCDKLVEINAPVGCLKKVGYVNLSGCLRFTDFEFHSRSEPMVDCYSATLDLVGESLDSCPLHPNSNLPKLQFRCSYDENLPSSVGNIEKLISFGLCACTDLKKVSDMICSLQCLEKLTLKGDIPEFPKDLGQLECLEELRLSSTEIKHLPDSICLLKRIKSLKVKNGDLLEKLPEDLGKLECLEWLHVSSKKIEYLPDSICMLKHLKSLEVKNGDLLEKLPEDLGKLECLERLHVSSKKIEYLPDSICMLKRLKSLHVIECRRLGKLPEDIDQLESLERLDLSSTEIKHLPDSICMLKHLKYLDLCFCHLLEKLPEDLGRLECLEHLDINDTGISHLPQSIIGLKHLFIFASSELLQLYDFPSVTKITSPIRLETRLEDVVSSLEMGFDEKLVGIETRVKDVVSSLKVGIDAVRMIGIKGMGGAGKTTTARAVYDYLSADFEATSFVENVREFSNGSMSGLKKLQEKVLFDVLNEHVSLHSVVDRKDMMKKRMCGKKVILVLDDVDHIEQLKALAGGPNWFKPGSRIIITTRDEQVLVRHRVNVIHDIDLLSEQEAICLFSRYAFGRENPLQGYEELSGKVVRYAAGLPLTVEVLGSFLCGKDMIEWEDAIDRLTRYPLKETLEKLELSYMGLEDDYKEIFLDIACILKGQTKEDAIRILESCGFNARIGLKVLEQRSLITLSSKYGQLVLGMHDHIEEMGKHIVRRSHPEEPNKHSRLWIRQEIEDILANDKGTKETRCLKLYMPRGNVRYLMKGLGKMKELRYLELNFVRDFDDDACLGSDLRFVDTNRCFTNSLNYLKCTNYPFLYLPKTFQANNLVGLEMESSGRMVQLWEEGEKKDLNKLKFLSLSGSELTTFDFRITPNLESLSLKYSFKLKELCMPDTCQKLKHLIISESELRSFDLRLTTNLEMLSLESSGKLEELCMPVSCKNLNYLCISHSKLRTFDLGLTPNLETLSLEGCAQFEELHVSVACPNLKFLNLSKSRLRSLDLEMIPNLERLDLAGCDELVEINSPIGCLEKVVHLNLSGCALLEKLPEDIGRFECLKELDITRTYISHLQQSIFGLKGLLIAADEELLELYDFPSEIETTTDPIEEITGGALA